MKTCTENDNFKSLKPITHEYLIDLIIKNYRLVSSPEDIIDLIGT